MNERWMKNDSRFNDMVDNCYNSKLLPVRVVFGTPGTTETRNIERIRRRWYSRTASGAKGVDATLGGVD